jgi:hypothetical protein
MIEVKVCRGPCERALPTTPGEFFAVHNKYGRLLLRSRCKECARVAQRTYSRRYAERNATDPSRAVMVESKRARSTRSQRERYHADIEESRRKQREKRKRQRKNSAARKAKREVARIEYRLQKEREGVALAEVRTGPQWNAVEGVSEYAAPFERLPAWPLAAAVRAEDARRQRAHFTGFLADPEVAQGDIAGTHLQVPGWTEAAERNVRAWHVGERLDVQFDVVDRVLTALGWCWWEVYNEQTVRRHSLVVAHRTPTVSVKKVAEKRVLPEGMGCRYAVHERGPYGSALPARAAKYSTVRRDRLGDEGPDLELLASVRHTFECTGFPSCSTCRDRREGEQTQMVLGEAA